MKIPLHTFLITGGSSGLGAATARMVAQNGGNALIADLDAASGADLENELGPQACFVPTDVTKEESVLAALRLAEERFGGLHGVVNCAGIIIGKKVFGKRGPHSLEAFEKIIRVNLIGTFNVIRLSVPLMARGEPNEGGERGVIINTSSIAASDGQIGQAAYSASKGGLASMTLPLARELSQHGIRVATIAPGIFRTAMTDNMPEAMRETLARQVPFPPRFGEPDEFAGLVRHITENAMINGAIIRLDGGLRMDPG